MTLDRVRKTLALAGALCLAVAILACESAPNGGAIHGLKVLSDKAVDLSSLEAIRAHVAGFPTDKEKAEEIFRLAVKYRHQANPALEYLSKSGHVHDPVKTLNVYGYCKCCCAAAMMMGLWRNSGLPSQGWSLVKHSVSDVFYDDEWHMYDTSLINYFVRDDGVVASSQDLVDLKHGLINHEHSPFIDEKGRYPARAQWLRPGELDDYEVIGDNHVYEYEYSLGHRTGLSLRDGETVVFHWGNRGLHINQRTPHAWDAPMTGTGPVRAQVYLKDWYPNYRMGLVGNGDLIYKPDLKSGAYRGGILEEENIAARELPGERTILGPATAGPAAIVFPFHSAYVFLDGTIRYRFLRASQGESIRVLVSRNHGLDWDVIRSIEGTGWIEAEIDLEPWVFSTYQHRIKIEMAGAPGTVGVESIGFAHVFQHNQRALPLLDRGANEITVAADQPARSTMTIEAALDPNAVGAFHPTLDGIRNEGQHVYLEPGSPSGSLTFPVRAPGPVRAVRFGGSLRAREPCSSIRLLVSDDGGRSWKAAGGVRGPFVGDTLYVAFDDIAPDTSDVLVRYEMNGPGVVGMFVFRIDVDYEDPKAAVRPVKVTYAWREQRREMTHSQVVTRYPTRYAIDVAGNPVMKSLTVEALPFP